MRAESGQMGKYDEWKAQMGERSPRRGGRRTRYRGCVTALRVKRPSGLWGNCNIEKSVRQDKFGESDNGT